MISNLLSISGLRELGGVPLARLVSQTSESDKWGIQDERQQKQQQCPRVKEPRDERAPNPCSVIGHSHLPFTTLEFICTWHWWTSQSHGPSNACMHIRKGPGRWGRCDSREAGKSRHCSWANRLLSLFHSQTEETSLKMQHGNETESKEEAWWYRNVVHRSSGQRACGLSMKRNEKGQSENGTWRYEQYGSCRETYIQEVPVGLCCSTRQDYASAGKCTLPSALLKVLCFVEQPCRRKVAFASWVTVLSSARIKRSKRRSVEASFINRLALALALCPLSLAS